MGRPRGRPAQGGRRRCETSSSRFGPELLPTPDTRPAAQDDLLMRLASLLADAPIGLPLTAQEVPRPAEQLPEDKAEVENDVMSARQVVCTSLPRPGRSGVTPAACQVSDDDGIAYMSCSTTTRTLWHDARSHCFTSGSIYSGPDSTDCLGRCGSGCGPWGGGIYTYDCGEHDYCVRVHPEGGNPSNPSHNDCGDEWWNADDDLIWGFPNCPWV